MSGVAERGAEPVRMPAHGLVDFVAAVLAAVDVPPEDAAIVADCLVAANLAGVDSHGVIRLAHYVRRLENGTLRARPHIAFSHPPSEPGRGPASALGIVEGDDGLGHVVMTRACTHAMALAESEGSGTVLVRNSSHFGMAGYYVRQMATQGYAAIVMTATDALLIPHGASKPFFGTNPLAIGFPTDGIPVVLDMATTSIPYGKVALAQIEGRPIPSDWGFDGEGHPTTDPRRIAGLHPIAGHKGSGLAMVIDIFCSVLTGMAWGPHINRMYIDLDEPRKLGHFVMALDIGRLMEPALFRQRLGEMLREFRELPPAEGVERVYYPGEIEGLRAEERRRDGIPIEPGLWWELHALGERLGVSLPE
ncbi:MAG: Ldh family oxidoreductase [Anaerolineales bacterium]|nr:Ldh family oxidoreductase [Anaerolineales bacterium]